MSIVYNFLLLCCIIYFNIFLRYPNVIFLTTSNVTEAIDSAFTDRADIKMLINPPKELAIYTILKAAVEELIKVKKQLLKY